MTVKITTEFGTFEGRTVQSAARRGYGKQVRVEDAPARVNYEGRIFDPRHGYVGTIYRVEGIAPGPLTEAEMLDAADLLDECMSLDGFIGADQRARLFALIENPSDETWSDAHGIILLDPAAEVIGGTLWNLLLACTHYRCHGRATGEPWLSIPTRAEVMTALRLAVAKNRAVISEGAAF